MNKYSISQLLKSIFRPLNRKIEKTYDIAKNINPQICSECKGLCCKTCGCHFSPNDFDKISYKYLKKELEKGYISIDCIKGILINESSDIYFLRIRNQNAPIVDIQSKSKATCMLLTSKGCLLTYQKRPSGGKLLIPSNKFNNYFGIELRKCTQTYPIKACCIDWKPYQKILKKLCNYFCDKDFKCNAKNEFN